MLNLLKIGQVSVLFKVVRRSDNKVILSRKVTRSLENNAEERFFWTNQWRLYVCITLFILMEARSRR